MDWWGDIKPESIQEEPRPGQGQTFALIGANIYMGALGGTRGGGGSFCIVNYNQNECDRPCRRGETSICVTINCACAQKLARDRGEERLDTLMDIFTWTPASEICLGENKKVSQE